MEYEENIVIENDGHKYTNDVTHKQVVIDGVGNRNIINTCILKIEDNDVTVQTGKTIETLQLDELEPAVKVMAELLIKNQPQKEIKKKTTKKQAKKTSQKKTSKKTTTKKTNKKGVNKDD